MKSSKAVRRVLNTLAVLALLASAVWWWLATLPKPLEEIYAVRFWDPYGLTTGLRRSIGSLELLDQHRLCEIAGGELLVYDLHCNPLWRFTKPGEFCSSFAAGTNGTLYIGTRKSNLFAYDLRYQLKWELDLDSKVAYYCQVKAKPDGGVYFLTDRDKLHAVSEQGKVQWQVEYPRRLPIELLVTKDGTLITQRFTETIAYSATGDELWRNTEISETCWLAGDSPEILLSYDPKASSFCAFSTSGQKLWEVSQTGGPLHYTRADGSPGIYFGEAKPYFMFHGRDLTGAVTWQYRGSNQIPQVCELADGRTLVVDTKEETEGYTGRLLRGLQRWRGTQANGQLTVFDKDNQQRAVYLLPFISSRHPLLPLSDGTVLILANDGMLYRYAIP